MPLNSRPSICTFHSRKTILFPVSLLQLYHTMVRRELQCAICAKKFVLLTFSSLLPEKTPPLRTLRTTTKRAAVPFVAARTYAFYRPYAPFCRPCAPFCRTHPKRYACPEKAKKEDRQPLRPSVFSDCKAAGRSLRRPPPLKNVLFPVLRPRRTATAFPFCRAGYARRR